MRKFIYWTPRILTILLIIFIRILAFDVFNGEYSGFELIIALFMHLVPTFILVGILILAWKKELIGGLVFIALAIFTVIFFNVREDPISLLFTTFPILIVGILFITNKYLIKKL